MNRRYVITLAVAYVGLVIAANWLAARYVITVPFTHLLAPGGVLAIGAVLVMRDWLQQLAGLRVTLGLLLVAGVASYVIGVAAGWTSLQRVALASIAAFIVSEGVVETLVFTPLRRRHLVAGVASSAVAGAAVDSWLFLTLAGFAVFGPDGFFRGQFVGKLEMVAVGVALTAARRRFVAVPT